MRCPSSFSDRGTVTAELAMGIPAIVGLVGIVLGGMRWGMDAITATTVAAETSLGIARGEPDNEALGRARATLPSAEWRIVHSAAEVCVIATIALPGVELVHQKVRQCAAV